MGDVLATSFRWIYVKLCKCQLSSPRRRRQRLSHRSHHKSDSSQHPHLYDQYEVQSRGRMHIGSFVILILHLKLYTFLNLSMFSLQ